MESDENIIMLEHSTHLSMPSHLVNHFHQISNPSSSLEAISSLVFYIGIECGFVSKNMDLRSIKEEYTWYYSFSRQVFNLALRPKDNEFIFKFVMDPSAEIVVKCLEISSDLVLVVAYEEAASTKICHCNSILLPISRYIPYKKLVFPSVASSFRHIKELCFMLKENIFFPMRNEIYYRNQNVAPWLNGMPELIMTKIYSFLNHKDRENLRRTCKTQHKFLTDMKNRIKY